MFDYLEPNYIIIPRLKASKLFMSCQAWSQQYTKEKKHFQDVSIWRFPATSKPISPIKIASSLVADFTESLPQTSLQDFA